MVELDRLDDRLGEPERLHEPRTELAKGLVDTLASRGLTASKLDAELRRAVTETLAGFPPR